MLYPATTSAMRSRSASVCWTCFSSSIFCTSGSFAGPVGPRTVDVLRGLGTLLLLVDGLAVLDAFEQLRRRVGGECEQAGGEEQGSGHVTCALGERDEGLVLGAGVVGAGADDLAVDALLDHVRAQPEVRAITKSGVNIAVGTPIMW